MILLAHAECEILDYVSINVLEEDEGEGEECEEREDEEDKRGSSSFALSSDVSSPFIGTYFPPWLSRVEEVELLLNQSLSLFLTVGVRDLFTKLWMRHDINKCIIIISWFFCDRLFV